MRGRKHAHNRAQIQPDISSRRLHSTQDVSSTIEIPPNAFIEQLALKRVSTLNIMAPGVAPVILSLGRKAISIGREDDCDVALPFDSVSRSHAHIEPTGEDFAIVDHESTNGTYVNNVRVSRCVLHNNDQIRVGSARLVFVQERVRESP